MRFAVFLPPQALGAGGKPVPALLFLAGLTCTEETFMMKAGAQRLAAQAGIALVSPDTSPRGAAVPGEADDWDFGLGAGFYLDAQVPPWSAHYRMESWIVGELLPLLGQELPVDLGRLGISGHSMGGHGAFTLALRHPGIFKSLSAFSPICSPTRSLWGRKAFAGYLGPDEAAWPAHDATLLLQAMSQPPYPQGILVDQGLADKFLDDQLQPALLQAACHDLGQPLTLRLHAEYDHGYYFISTFIPEHIAHHAQNLR